MKLIIFLLFLPVEVMAFGWPSSFDITIERCVAQFSAQDRNCKSEDCSLLAKANSCMENLGVKKNSCTLDGNVLICKPDVASKLFPDTRGCELNIRMAAAGGTNSVFRAPKRSSCFIHEYELDKKVSFPAALVTAGENGTWKIPTPVIAFQLNKFLKPSDVLITDVSYRKATDESNDCRNDDLSRLDDSLREIHREHFKIEHAAVPQRHFTGPNGENEFIWISNFRTKNDLKLCSRNILKGTEFYVNDSDSCGALADGAVELSGFPKSLVPKSNSTKETGSGKETTSCAPLDRKFFDLKNFRGSPAFQPFPKTPTINWEQCDCGIPPLRQD